MRAFEQRKKDSPASTSFFGPKIQKKLKTGTAGDQFEVEADRVADKVVNNNSSGGGLLQSRDEVQQKPISETISSVQAKDIKDEESVQKKSDKEEDKKLQKKSDKEEDKKVQKKSDKEEDKKVQKKGDKKEEEKPIQAKCAECEKEDKVQKKDKKEEEKKVQKKEQNPEAEVQDNELEGKLDNSKGGGNGLDKKTKREMESGFGTDFSNVKIHTDTNAVQMSQELGAQAFTNGNDLYFNKGKYSPDSKEGKHLLAHELTHTVQQTGGKQKSGTIQKSSITNKEPLPEDLRTEKPKLKDNITLEKTNDNQTIVSTGQKGPYVKELQKGLLEAGQSLPKYGADGDFGSETRNAVIGFQSQNSLNRIDGIVGKETIGVLDNTLVEKRDKKDPESKDCGTAVKLNLSGSCFDYMNTCITETFSPDKSSALKIEVDVDYMTPQPEWIKEDVSIQVMKCSYPFDTKIGSKRVSAGNIPLKMSEEIKSVTPGDKYYVKIFSRSSSKLKTSYTISQ